MQELVWINGESMSLADACISVEDRGFQFAEGVYEVVRIYDGTPFALRQHLERLEHSRIAIDLTSPIAINDLELEIFHLTRRSRVLNGSLYIQLTRGSAPRNHLYPAVAKPTLLFYIRELNSVAPAGSTSGCSLISVPDERWHRCWIKSISLLANTLARNAAAAAGADEAAFVDDGLVTECSSSNLFAVIDGSLVTAPVGPRVLPGITRAVLLELAAALHIPVQQRALRYAEALNADEIFITSTLREVGWVSRWDGQTIGDGCCGPTTLRLQKAFLERIGENRSVSSGMTCTAADSTKITSDI